jgi:RNA polymerase sigma-70 factor, ECF subfamily
MRGPRSAGKKQPPRDIESGLPADLESELRRSNASLTSELSDKLDVEAGLASITEPAKREAAERKETGSSTTSRAVAGEAFIRALYAEHGGALLRYALHLTGGDRQRAEDIVQETMVRAWRYPEAVAGRPVRPWLFAVARNLAVDAYRARQSRPPETGRAALELLPADDGPDRTLESSALAEVLASLRLEHRKLIIECHYRGCSVAEAAATLGIPVGTVKTHMFCALKALKAALQERGLVPRPVTRLRRAARSTQGRRSGSVARSEGPGWPGAPSRWRSGRSPGTGPAGSVRTGPGWPSIADRAAGPAGDDLLVAGRDGVGAVGQGAAAGRRLVAGRDGAEIQRARRRRRPARPSPRYGIRSGCARGAGQRGRWCSGSWPPGSVS